MSYVQDLKNFVSQVWDDVREFFTELPVTIFEAFLSAISWVVESIPTPEFMSGTSISDHLTDELVWFAVQIEFPIALGIIASGIGFYFLRRILTLGIW